MKIDFKKSAEHAGNAIEKVAEIGKIAADNAKTGAQLLVNKAQEESYNAQKKKYNPVFPDQYKNPNFGLPNLIKIVDDVVRKNIDICNGAIGWKAFKKGIEVFHLYDEAIEFSGLHFTPSAVCDAIYYVDPHDRSHFIRLDRYFEEMQKSKVGELQNIASSLGAKKYRVEIYDTSNMKRTINQKADVKGSKNGIVISSTEERNMETENASQNEFIVSAEFAGERHPSQPTLQWFSYDDTIKSLIHTRCTGENENGLKIYNFFFKGKDLESMSISTAMKLNATANSLGGVDSNFDLQSKTVEESHHNIKFQLEF